MAQGGPRATPQQQRCHLHLRLPLLLLLLLPLSLFGTARAGRVSLEPSASLEATSERHSALTVARELEGCTVINTEVLKRLGQNLTQAEEALLSDVCIPPRDLPLILEHRGRASNNYQVHKRKGIPEGTLCEETTWCDGNNHCTSVCRRGSVQLEDWYTNALKLQLSLAYEQPLCYSQLPGSHNSGITLADGYGNLDELYESFFPYVKYMLPEAKLATNNQWLSLTDQLNMGVRTIELDTHWVEGDLRVAHCGGLHLKYLDKLVRLLNLIAKLFGYHVEWDSETMGCFPSLSSIAARDQRTMVDALQEILSWMSTKRNHQDFVVVFFDVQHDLDTWHKVPLMLEQIKSVIPLELILTPTELVTTYNGVWPPIRDLISTGKRIVFVSGVDFGEHMSSLVFPRDGSMCFWSEPHLWDFSGPDACAIEAGYHRRETMTGRIVRFLTCEIEYGPLNCNFEWGPNWPLLDEGTLPDVTSCGVNMPTPDRVTPQKMEAQIWSWAPGHPYAGVAPQSGPGPSARLHPTPRRSMLQAQNASMCAAISSEDSRWYSVECHKADLPMVCRHKDGLGSDKLWRLSHETSCPTNYVFDIPRSPKENMLLGTTLRGQSVSFAALPLKGPYFWPDWLSK